jgi:hypothetical protein
MTAISVSKAVPPLRGLELCGKLLILDTVFSQHLAVTELIEKFSVMESESSAS